MENKPKIPEVTPDIACRMKETLLSLYAHQMGIKKEDLKLEFQKKTEPA